MNQSVARSPQERHHISRQPALGPVVVGFGTWAIGCLLLRPGWIEILLLLGPLVVVPLGLGLRQRESVDPRLGRLRLACAGPLFPAVVLDQGPIAAALSVPWLIATLPGAISAARARLINWRSLDSDFLFDVSYLFLSIGAAGLVVQRAGVQPMGLPHVINLLFAVHYHYAGFGLATMSAMLASDTRNSRLETLAGTGSVSAVLLLAVAIGFADWLAPLGAIWMAATGAMVAALQARASSSLRGPERTLLLASSAAGLVAMPLGAAYGLRMVEPFAWLTIPWMAAVHGTLNAFGFVLGGLLGWTLALRPRRSRL
jgi:hypothetical protein